MKSQKTQSLKEHLIQVIIETPRGSRYKYDYDPEQHLFKLDKIMPLGTVFPFDFGFIPGTKGEDGDPLDVLVIADEPILQGTLVACRIIGTLRASQTERNGKSNRNDRTVAVADCSNLYKDVTKLSQLDKDLAASIEHFFVQYNQEAGKKFAPLGWAGEASSRRLIKRQGKNIL